MKFIPLSQGQVTLVDDEDFEALMTYGWYASWNPLGCTFFAIRQERNDVKTSTIYMHRQIREFPEGFEVDHKDHDTLNNQRSNLRIATTSQNRANRRSYKGASKFKGVYWHKANQCWYSGIRVNGRTTYLGSFAKEEDAAMAYDVAAVKHYGEFAFVNFRGCLEKKG